MNTRADIPFHLLFPQWQGSGAANARRLYEGAWQIQGRLAELEFAGVPVDTEAKESTEAGIVARADILQHARRAHALLAEAAPERIVTIGGDCGVDLVPASYLASRYGDDLAVVWLDAHADLNTPASSPSGTFHGMVLRSLLGEGDGEVLEQTFAPLEPYQVFLAGVRTFDPPEFACFEEKRLSLFKPEDLAHPERLTEQIAARGFTKLHVHLDLDVLEPTLFPSTGYPTPHGVTPDTLTELLRALQETFELVGFTLTEFAPERAEDLEMVVGILEGLDISSPLRGGAPLPTKSQDF